MRTTYVFLWLIAFGLSFSAPICAGDGNDPVKPDMVLIPSGTYEMGNSTSPDEGWPNELPVHKVTVGSLFMSKYKITNGQYCAFLNAEFPSQLKVVDGKVYASSDSSNNFVYCYTLASHANSQIEFSDDSFRVLVKEGRDMANDPVVLVNWYGAVVYCNWRSQQEGMPQCYALDTWNCDLTKKGYRLPSEAEWEFAARGGFSSQRFPWGMEINHSLANYYSGRYVYDTSSTQGYHPRWNVGVGPYTSPVGYFSANAYGIYDMTGNVYDWCNDWFSSNYSTTSPQTNPRGPTTGNERVFRGGSWGSDAADCRVAYRGHGYPDGGGHQVGFRIVLDRISYSGGSGTEADPYQISTVADWQELMTASADWDKSFILMVDLDLAGISMIPVGAEGNPFVGVFDGNGHIIRNATINQPTSTLVGLFGYLESGGLITNLGLVDAIISGNSYIGGIVGKNYSGVISSCYVIGNVTSTSGYIGGIVGWDTDGTITSCHVTGNVTSTSNYVGGIVGMSTSSAITSCYATGTVGGHMFVGGITGDNDYGTITSCYTTCNINGFTTVGGITGQNYSGIITSCYSMGSVSGDAYVGGLVGETAYGGTISSCYATGAVTGNHYIGGLVARNYEGTIITASFWDKDTSGLTKSAGGTGLNTIQMQNLSTFISAGWDFVGETVNGTADIWRMPTGGYPILSWQSFVESGVYFADAKLKAAVEAQLGVTNPTAEDMLGLTYLNAVNKGIGSLIGLETAGNLEALNLDQNAVSDLAPLAGLTKMATLTLYSNAITDISPLAGLTKLYSLVVSVNQVSDITPLAGLDNLMYLYINSNQISDFSALTGNTKFREIYAARNAVLTKETYLAHIPAIRANNAGLAVFQYDPGCKAVMSGDLNQDCRVNLADLAMMAANWLKCNHIYEEMCE